MAITTTTTRISRSPSSSQRRRRQHHHSLVSRRQQHTPSCCYWMRAQVWSSAVVLFLLVTASLVQQCQAQKPPAPAKSESESLLNTWSASLPSSSKNPSSASDNDKDQQQQQPPRNSRQQRLLTPCEIFWDSQVRVALAELRNPTTNSVHHSDNDVTRITELSIQNCFYNDGTNKTIVKHFRTPRRYLTLTLVGFKGGAIAEQVNQDRAFIFLTTAPAAASAAASGNPQDAAAATPGDDGKVEDVLISGVMDGHGHLGHLVAEWSRHQLLERFSAGLNRPIPKKAASSDTSTTNVIPKLVSDVLVGIDRDMPDTIAREGGATASLVVRRNDTMYFCNAGDSQTFLVAAIVVDDNSNNKNNKNAQSTKLQDVQVVYSTILHKPDLPEERRRLEAAGSSVEGSSDTDDARVWYVSDENGKQYGLAMSRALGDRGALGVTAEPEITIRRIPDVIADVVQKYNQQQQQEEATCRSTGEVQADGSAIVDKDAECGRQTITKDLVHLFAVSATDGVLDYAKGLEEIAYPLAQGLYEDKKHLVTVTEDVLLQSAGRWNQENQGEYRDDMAISVAQLT